MRNARFPPGAGVDDVRYGTADGCHDVGIDTTDRKACDRVGVHPAQLQEAFAIWWELAYKDLRLDGRLANAVQPWGLFAAPVVATVRSTDETPYCTESADPLMARVLGHEWPHGQVLDAYSDTD